MKCQILVSGKNKKNIINPSSAENAQRVVKVKIVVVNFIFYDIISHISLQEFLPKNRSANQLLVGYFSQTHQRY